MHVCMCICACVNVCVWCVCVYVFALCECVCMCVCMCTVYVYVHMYMCECVYVCTCMCISVCICIYMCECVCVWMCMCMYDQKEKKYYLWRKERNQGREGGTREKNRYEYNQSAQITWIKVHYKIYYMLQCRYAFLKVQHKISFKSLSLVTCIVFLPLSVELLARPLALFLPPVACLLTLTPPLKEQLVLIMTMSNSSCYCGWETEFLNLILT